MKIITVVSHRRYHQLPKNTKMKGTVAMILIVVSMVAAEVPRTRVHLARQINTPQQQQQQQPYMPSGWRPNGQQFNLPLKYGPPPPAVATEQTETEQTTTELPTTTDSSYDEQQKPLSGKLRENPDDVEEIPQQPKQQYPQVPQQQPGQFFVLLPNVQNQNLLYTATPQQQTQKLIVAQQQQQQFYTPAKLQLTTVFTPFSASYVQILQ